MLFAKQSWHSSLLLNDRHSTQIQILALGSLWPLSSPGKLRFILASNTSLPTCSQRSHGTSETATLSCPLFILQISLFWVQAQARPTLRLSDDLHSPCWSWDISKPGPLLSHLTPTYGKLFYIMSSCASCPTIPASCAGTSCASQQPHCMDADLSSHQIVSEFPYYAIFFLSKMFSPVVYFFTLSNPTSLVHYLLFTNSKPEGIFL